MKECFLIPGGRNASGKKRLHFRGEIKCAVIERVKKWFDAKSIARCKQNLIWFIPEYERKLTAQMFQTMRTKLFIKMQCNFAIGFCAKLMTALLQLALNPLVIIKFTVYNNMERACF